MSDFDQLLTRIDEAKKRLGIVDEDHARQFESLKGRLSAVKDGLVRTQSELDEQKQELTRLSRENEQLRGMLHKLLLAIESSYGERLKDILQDIEGQIMTLVDLTGPPESAEDEDTDPAETPVATVTATVTATGPVALVEPPAGHEETAPMSAKEGDTPDDTDSRWLAEIMETAKDLTTNRKQAAS